MGSKIRSMRRKINRDTVPVKMVPIMVDIYDELVAIAKAITTETIKEGRTVSANYLIHNMLTQAIGSFHQSRVQEQEKAKQEDSMILQPGNIMAKMKKEEIDRAAEKGQ